MSLPVNDKNATGKGKKNQKNTNSGSKFIKTSNNAGGAKQKVRANRANRGS